MKSERPSQFEVDDKPPKEELTDYIYTFPKGETFEAKENSDGTVEVALKKDGKKILDFYRLLPDGYRIVAPSFLKTSGLYKGLPGGPEEAEWSVNFEDKIIIIGKFETPQKDILGLLHEIGHVALEGSGKEQTQRDEIAKEWREAKRNLPYRVLLQEESAKISSMSERRAWAYALSTARVLNDRFGVDLLALFPTVEILKKHIEECLASHRSRYAWTLKHDPDFNKELKTLFDRGRHVNDPDTEKYMTELWDLLAKI